MTQFDSADKPQRPAAHPTLTACIDTALACLKAWARANGQNWDALTHPNALLLQTLLNKSKQGVCDGAAPILPLNVFKGLLQESLTGRRWVQFLKWYSREICETLKATCRERGDMVVFPARSSTGNGGRGENAQAVYFLSFEEPPLLNNAHVSEVAAQEMGVREGGGERSRPQPEHVKNEYVQAVLDGLSIGGSSGDALPKQEGQKHVAQTDHSRNADEMLPLIACLNMNGGYPSGSASAWGALVILVLFFAACSDSSSSPWAGGLSQMLVAVREALFGPAVIRF